MSPEMQLLLGTGISIALLHTLTGPDHYIPFIALSKSRNWTVSKTLFWTVTCGLGHVASSVLLALGGAAIGWSIKNIRIIENVRGGLASWVLLIFGLVYLIWGLYSTSKHKAHKHFESAADGSMYVFEHNHLNANQPVERHRLTPWVMFIIFLLGPCEPMIPLLYFPAAQSSISGMVWLIVIYTSVTLFTMVSMVLLGFYGIAFLNTQKLEKHMHVLAGLTLCICGAGMVFLEW